MMPARFFSAALCSALLPAFASAQIHYKYWGLVSASQIALPSEGPAAARINPAELADVHIASAAYGHAGSLSRKSGGGAEFLQLAAGAPWDSSTWPVRLAAGFGYLMHHGEPESVNALFQESEYDPAIAIRILADPEDRWRLAAGLGLDIVTHNAFNVVHSTSYGIDLGVLASLRFGKAGRFGLGFAYHDLKSPRARLPENGGEYEIPGWREYSFDWASPNRVLRLRLGWFSQEDWSQEDGPHWQGQYGVNDWEAEMRVVTWLALKAERVHIGSLSNVAGMVLYLPRELTSCDTRMEINVGNSRFGGNAIPSPFRQILLLDKTHDSGPGWQIGLSLSVGI